MRFIINGIKIDVDPLEWPEDSTFRLMYEGDRNADEYSLNNPKISDESIQVIFMVVEKNLKFGVLDTDELDWDNLNYITNYLGLGMSVDFIYPLLLTPEDRIDWYYDCKLRQTHICEYDEKEEGELITVKIYEMKKKELYYDTIEAIGTKEESGSYGGKSAYGIIGTTGESGSYGGKSAYGIIDLLRDIPDLFVAGAYPLADFDSITRWDDIDIYAYGPDALKNIITGVKICLANSKYKPSDIENLYSYIRIPFRTRYSISIPTIGNPDRPKGNRISDPIVIIQFILLEYDSPYEILSGFDIDIRCIGFYIQDPETFYCLPRFIKAFEMDVNIVDSTRNNSTYIAKLMSYSDKGYKLAIPGYNMENIRMSQKILSTMLNTQKSQRNEKLRSLNLKGLEALVVSSMIKTTITENMIQKEYSRLIHGAFTAYLPRLIPSLKRGDEPVDFVIGDVLDERRRKRTFNFSGYSNNVSYIPKYPRIELVEKDSRIRFIHQVKSSFYGSYFGIVGPEI
uniref:Ankyrin repeat protein n=1 Tax=Pithovirus LCPAC406 TaxID=2506599 RepID=A0A481ZGH0_9VIRU|nr:MAG: ankyrin repeat protein [Pithovirus LCPAC406]